MGIHHRRVHGLPRLPRRFASGEASRTSVSPGRRGVLRLLLVTSGGMAVIGLPGGTQGNPAVVVRGYFGARGAAYQREFGELCRSDVNAVVEEAAAYAAEHPEGTVTSFYLRNLLRVLQDQCGETAALNCVSEVLRKNLSLERLRRFLSALTEAQLPARDRLILWAEGCADPARRDLVASLLPRISCSPDSMKDLMPQTPLGLLWKGQGLLQLSRRAPETQRTNLRAESIACLSPATKARETALEACLWLGYANLETGDADAAIEALDRAVELQPSSSSPRFARARAYEAAGLPGRARQEREAGDRMRESERERDLRSEEGLRHSLAQGRNGSKMAVVGIARGEGTGRYLTEAVQGYSNALEYHAPQDATRLRRVLLYACVGKWPEARQDAETLMEQRPEWSYPRRLRQRAIRELGDATSGAQTVGEGVSLPELPDAPPLRQGERLRLDFRKLSAMAQSPQTPEDAEALAQALIAPDIDALHWGYAFAGVEGLPEDLLRLVVPYLNTYVVAAVRPDIACFEEPARLLGRAGDGSSVPYLVVAACTQGPPPRNRLNRTAVRALTGYPADVAVPALRTVLARDPDPVTRELVETALTKADPQAVGDYYTGLILAGSRQQQVLGADRLEGDLGLLTLVEIVTDTSVSRDTAQAAADALGHFDREVCQWAKAQVAGRHP